jgi:hypothetical protein
MKNLAILMAAICPILSGASGDEPTWVEIEGVVYGAKPDHRGPIGGGAGYVNIVTRGDYTVNNLDELLNALSRAKTGQIIFITTIFIIVSTRALGTASLIIRHRR